MMLDRDFSQSFRFRTARETEPKTVVRIEEYGGESRLCIHCTQLGASSSGLEPQPFTRAQRARILTDWIDFLRGNPKVFTELNFCSRVPQALFDAVCCQKRLRRLEIKWGQYPDLSAIAGLRELRLLHLGPGRSVTDLRPISALAQLEGLSLESLACVNDYSPLARLRRLVSLDLSGDIWAPRDIHLRDLAFLRDMPQLRRFALSAAVVDSGDYSPILSLEHAHTVCRLSKRQQSVYEAALRSRGK